MLTLMPNCISLPDKDFKIFFSSQYCLFNSKKVINNDTHKMKLSLLPKNAKSIFLKWNTVFIELESILFDLIGKEAIAGKNHF